MVRLSWAMGALAMVGCASTEVQFWDPTHSDTEVVSPRISAARMYQTAEAMVEEGYYADAVRLMRHAILSLPRTAELDDLRPEERPVGAGLEKAEVIVLDRHPSMKPARPPGR